jgi:hypothetical protein
MDGRTGKVEEGGGNELYAAARSFKPPCGLLTCVLQHHAQCEQLGLLCEDRANFLLSLTGVKEMQCSRWDGGEAYIPGRSG